MARLKEGASIESAQANMAAIAKQLERQYPDSNREQGASVIPCAEADRRQFTSDSDGADGPEPGYYC